MIKYVFVKDITSDDSYHMVPYNNEKIKLHMATLTGSKITRANNDLYYDSLVNVMLSSSSRFNAFALFDKYVKKNTIITHELLAKLDTICRVYKISEIDIENFPFAIRYYLFHWHDEIQIKVNTVNNFSTSERSFFFGIICSDLKEEIDKLKDKIKGYTDKINKYTNIISVLK